MKHRNIDPEYDPDQIEEQDPTGEQAFDEAGFEDAADGGPMLEAPGLETPEERPAGGAGQKQAGVPEAEQHRTTTPSEQHPDTPRAVIRDRGGAEKGDPAVGGTRPD